MYTGYTNLEDCLYNHIALQAAARVNADVYGIEVELEGRNITPAPPSVHLAWGSHKDGSLRCLLPGSQAIEYVCREPYDMQHTQQVVGDLIQFLTSPGVEVFESYRTSIHVHVNMGNETFRTIYNMMAISLILDELLVSQNGEHRIGNNFCFRAKDAMGQTIQLVNSIESGNGFFGIAANERYSSINFASLTKFGSIEYRSLECTTHEGRIMHWIGTLAAMKDAAKQFKNPVEVISRYSQIGPQAFLQLVLGPYAQKYINVPGMVDMLHNGMRIAQDLAYASAWNEQLETEKPAVKTEKQKYQEYIKKQQAGLLQLGGAPPPFLHWADFQPVGQA